MGLLVGLFCIPIGGGLAARGQRPGLAIAFAVNAILPLVAVGLGVWHPRPMIAALGGVLTYASFAVGGLAAQWPRFWEWSPATAVSVAHPVLVLGAVASAGLAAIAAGMVSPWRVVGLPPDPARCPVCGYARGGLARCPECGGPRK